MRFFISRVSASREEKPCEEAFETTYTRIDERGADDPTKISYFQSFPERVQQEWYGEGVNHRVEQGHIKRDFPGEKDWAIDIESLDQFYTLYRKYGDLMIRQHIFSKAPEIKIVDDYL